MRQCGRCHAAYERQRRRVYRQRAAGLTIQKSASAIARAPSLERISALLDLLVTGLGGPQNFHQYWLDEIERLKSKRRPTFRLLRFCEMLANVELLRDEMAAERRKLSGSPEWRTALQSELWQLVRNNPEVVAEAAEKLGCRITPLQNAVHVSVIEVKA